MSEKYVAFLRAINVGGKRSVKMDDLKRMFESFGCENVSTYIQSGNVIFETKEADSSTLERRIESQLEAALHFKVDLFLRSMDEMADIVKKSPFEQQGEETLFISLLHSKPTTKAREAVLALSTETDSFAVRNCEVYWLRRDREKSPFNNNMIEKALGMPATARNLNTMSKILQKYG